MSLHRSLLVVGNIAYDTIADVKFLPSANQATSIKKLTISNGGCAGNVAVVASKLGIKTALYSSVGEDFKSSAYLKQLREFNIDLSYLQYVKGLTARSFIFTDGKENQQIYYYAGASSKLAEKDADFSRFTNVHFTAGELSIYKNLMKKAVERDCIISFDPGQEMFHRPVREQVMECLPFVSYLFLNKHECNFLLNFIGSKDVYDLFTGRIKTIVVSKGKDGATIYDRKRIVEVPAVKVDNIEDPTGAGDAHRAGFLVGLMKGYDERIACMIGNIVASFVIQKKGTQTNAPSWKDVEGLLHASLRQANER